MVKRGRLKRAKGSPKPWRRAATADLGVLRPAATACGRRARHRGPGSSRRPRARRSCGGCSDLFAANADGDEPSRVFGARAPQRRDRQGRAVRRAALRPHRRLARRRRQPQDHAARGVRGRGAGARRAAAARPTRRRCTPTADVGLRWLLKAHPRPDLFIGIVGDVARPQHRLPRPGHGRRRHPPGRRRPLRLPDHELEHLGQRRRRARARRPAQRGRAARHLPGRRARVVRGRPSGPTRSRSSGTRTSRTSIPTDIFTDDLAFAALELHRATGDPALLAEAVDAFGRGSDDDQLYAGHRAGDRRAARRRRPVRRPRRAEASSDVGCCGAAQGGQRAARARRRDARSLPPAIITFGSLQDNGGAGAVAAAAKRAGVAADGLQDRRGRARLPARPQRRGGASFVVGPRRHRRQAPAPPGVPRGARPRSCSTAPSSTARPTPARCATPGSSSPAAAAPLQLEGGRLRGPARRLRDVRGLAVGVGELGAARRLGPLVVRADALALRVGLGRAGARSRSSASTTRRTTARASRGPRHDPLVPNEHGRCTEESVGS